MSTATIRFVPSHHLRRPFAAAGTVAPLAGPVAGRPLITWQERAQQRRHLQSLGDHMLRDIGLSRADVQGESAKPFWRP